METKKYIAKDITAKIKLLDSAKTLAEFFGVEINKLLAFVVLGNDDKKEEWNKLATEVIEFYKLPLEQRIRSVSFKESQ